MGQISENIVCEDTGSKLSWVFEMGTKVIAAFSFAWIFLLASCTGVTLRPVVTCPAFVDEGDTLACTCGPPKDEISAEITWPGHSSGPSLKVGNVSREDNGTQFKCRMVWSGQETEQVYTLQVASNEANPEPIYRWMGVICDNGNNERTCNYKPKPLWDDGKVVTCRALNPSTRAVKSAIANFTLNMSYPPSRPPTIEGYTLGQYLRSGDNLTCTVTGGKPLVSKVDFSYKTAIFSFTVNDIPSSATVDAHRQVVFKCTALGRPAPNLTLLKPDSEEVLDSSIGSQEIVYAEPSISCKDAGMYACLADNGFLDSDSKTIKLRVECGLDADTRLTFIIAGGASGGLLLVIIAGIVIWHRRYRKYERPLRRRDEEEEENPYTSLARQRPPSLPPRRQQPENLELYEVTQCDNDDSDENPYDEIHARARAEKRPKKRRGICPGQKKRKKKQTS
ncbi:hypothetical protein BaRGS_00029699, partial [Batillaria attramentaria]